MPIYKIRNMGKYGVITDIPQYDAPIEAWATGRNVRFTSGRVEKMNGWSPLAKPRVGSTDKYAQFLMQEPTTQAMLFGTSRGLYRVDGSGNPTTISNVTYGLNNESPWRSAVLSNVVVFNSSLVEPVAWNPTTTTGKVIALPGWGIPKTGTTTKVTWRAKRIVAYKNYLVAINMNEDVGAASTPFPQRVRWSDSSLIGQLPTNWYEDGPTTDGGFNDLADCFGELIEARQLRDYLILYTTSETFIMKYIGGTFIFDIQKLFPDSGILDQDCVTEFEGGQHFVVTQNDIIVHDGSTRTSIVTDTVKEFLMSDIVQSNYKSCRVFTYPYRKEIWVCYNTLSAEAQSTEDNYACNKAAVWNWKDGTWTFADLPSVYWMDYVDPPNADGRSWENPSALTSFITPTGLGLDSPAYSLPISSSQNVWPLFKAGEGITTASQLTWSSSNTSVLTIANGNAADGAGVAVVTARAVGSSTITVSLTSNTAIKASFTMYVTAAGTSPVYMEQASNTSNPPPDAAHTRQDSFPDPDNQWDSEAHSTEVWEKKGFTFNGKIYLACSDDGGFYQMDTGQRWEMVTPSESSPVISSFSKYGISLQDVEDSLSRQKTLRTIYPLMTGQGDVVFTVGGSDDAYQAPVVVDTQLFTIGDDYKVDAFSNYRYLSIGITDDTEGSWSFSGFDFDYFFTGAI